jgi:type II secretory pathway predicted ATPase ExeA
MNPVRIDGMYKEHFGFTEEPFGTTPDPRFFYENPSYREAYSHLLWGLTERRGVMTLIGAVGTGKTTILRHLVARSKPAVRCILAEYPPSSFDELLTFACRELGMQRSDRGGRLDQVTALKQALLESHAQNVTTALLLDEAQQLPEEALEGVRLLSNLESAGEKALQIVLAGQPELHTTLDRPALAPLKQRVGFWGRLDRLKHGEIAAYVEYRLRVAGYQGPALFGPPAVEAIGFYSGGVPRLVNVLCRDALVAAHRTGQRVVSPDTIVQTARNLHVGPAFDFTPSQPNVPDTPPPSRATPAPEPIRPAPEPTRPAPEPTRPAPEPTRPAPEPIGADRPPARSGGELHKAQATTPPPATRRPGRSKAKRGWFWAAIVVVACGVAGLGALALVRSLTPSVARLKDLSTTRPVTSKVAGGNVQVAAVPDPSARPSESLVPSGPPSAGAEGTPPAAAGAPAPPETGAAASDRPNTAEATGAVADAPGSAGAPASDRTTVAAEVSGVIARPPRDTAEYHPLPKRTGDPVQEVLLQRGSTVIGVTQRIFGSQMYLALDLLSDLNPEIDDLNWVLAGQVLRLPVLDRDDLVYKQRDGSFSMIVDSFPSPADARRLSEVLRSHGYAAVVTPRRLSNDLVLARVEIKNLVGEAAARRAWEARSSGAWLWPRAHR